MKQLFLIPILTIFSSCSEEGQPDQPNWIETGFIVQNESHKVTVFINDEPVKVFPPGKSGPVPILMFGKKGENIIHASIQNSKSEPGQVMIEIIEGNWMEPEKMKHQFSWASDKTTDQFPPYRYKADDPLLVLKEELQPFSISEEDAKQLIKEHLKKYIAAYQSKQFGSMGISRAKMDKMMQDFTGADNFCERVFEVEDYAVETIADEDDIEVVFGKHTILGYSKKGEVFLRAGPLNRESNNGEMVFSTSLEGIFLGFDGEHWIPAYY